MQWSVINLDHIHQIYQKFKKPGSSLRPLLSISQRAIAPTTGSLDPIITGQTFVRKAIIEPAACDGKFTRQMFERESWGPIYSGRRDSSRCYVRHRGFEVRLFVIKVTLGGYTRASSRRASTERKVCVSRWIEFNVAPVFRAGFDGCELSTGRIETTRSGLALLFETIGLFYAAVFCVKGNIDIRRTKVSLL